MVRQDIVKNGKIGTPELNQESKATKALTRIMVGCVFIVIVLVFYTSLDFQVPILRNITFLSMIVTIPLTVILGGIVVFSNERKLKKIETYVGLLLCIIFITAATSSIKKNIAIKKLQEAQTQINKLEGYPRSMIVKKHNKIVYYVKNKYRKIPNVVVEKIAAEVVVLSKKEEVPIPILMGIINVESGFNPSSASKKLARGLMQVRWDVWKTVLKKDLGLKNQFDLHNIKEGMQAGIYIFKHYMKKNEGDMSLALYDYVGKDRNYATKVYEAIGDYIAYGGSSDEPEIQRSTTE